METVSRQPNDYLSPSEEADLIEDQYGITREDLEPLVWALVDQVRFRVHLLIIELTNDRSAADVIAKTLDRDWLEF